MAGKSKENYLEYIPKHNELYKWFENDEKLVVVKVLNRGLFNRIAQLLFRKPKVSEIELDEFGSFVWKQIDGKRTIYDIGLLLKEHFGEKAEPLYERLSKYMVILRNNSFIVYMNKK